MNENQDTAHRINKRITFSNRVFRSYYYPLQVIITSTRAVRQRVIVIGVVEGQRERVVFDYSTTNVVRVIPDGHNQPREELDFTI